VALRPPLSGQLLAGFLLTLASTAATLVPPYLTMPLMDDDPDPVPERQAHRHQPRCCCCWAACWRGLAGLGPGLGRTYILALVSERIGADLRTTTYEHLLRCRWSTSAASAPAT
jgi:ATP-binding cassette subfamily B protein